jgi:hypothetical protein
MGYSTFWVIFSQTYLVTLSKMPFKNNNAILSVYQVRYLIRGICMYIGKT